MNYTHGYIVRYLKVEYVCNHVGVGTIMLYCDKGEAVHNFFIFFIENVVLLKKVQNDLIR